MQEFIDYHGSAGIQHVAFLVENIIATVSALMQRNVSFVHIPDSYYDALERRLQSTQVNISEDIQMVSSCNANHTHTQLFALQLRQLRILIDFDDHGYLLQIFTQPMQDRPTLFIEIIQRHNFNVTLVSIIDQLHI